MTEDSKMAPSSEDDFTLQYSAREFVEHEKVDEIINNLTDETCDDEIVMERAFELLNKIVDRYQEQPHVIDPYLEGFITALLSKGRDRSNTKKHSNQAFTYLYLITKMRGYKVVIRYFPHEVSDLEPILSFLEDQDPNDAGFWQTRYILLLWLSIISKVPFDMSRFDSLCSDSAGAKNELMMDRILEAGRRCLWTHDKGQEAAAYLLSQFLTRPDVKAQRLNKFVTWALDNIKMTPAGADALFESASDLAGLHATLNVLALLFKHGKREDLLCYASPVLRKLTDSSLGQHPVSTIRRLATKIVNRIGLTFLKVRLASWRYTRGSRSLQDNLSNNLSGKPMQTDGQDVEVEEDFDIEDEVEEVVEFLLTALKDRETIVRWSAAKGVGRVTGRLPRELGDQVVGSILDLFSPFEGDGAWHGGCLTLAELGRRGLILPERLPQVVPVVAAALVYEDRRGNYATGAHVRDAACYVAWSFARAYDPHVIRPYVQEIAGALLVVTVFDREVNCRRAASAAFQENVGRQGEFPHGIEILTTADYFAVGLRSHAYIHLSSYIAQFSEYTNILIEHLVKLKVNHWDSQVRELTGSALASLTSVAPSHMASNVLSRLISVATSSDFEARHGAIIATGEVTRALSVSTRGEKSREDWDAMELVTLMGHSTWIDLLNIIPKLKSNSMYKGLAGEWMKKASCYMIHCLSEAGLPLQLNVFSDLQAPPKDMKKEWLVVLNEVLHHADPTVSVIAIDALPYLVNSYFSFLDSNKKRVAVSDEQRDVIDSYINVILSTKQERSRQGHSLALASLPKFMFEGRVTSVITALQQSSQITTDTVDWAEARRDAIVALSKVIITVGFASNDASDVITSDLFCSIMSSILLSLQDYTLDSRGDVGSLVREAGLTSLQEVLSFALKSSKHSLLSPEMVSAAMTAVVQQSCEKIDRTRAIAGQAFEKLLSHDPPLPHLPAHENLLTIFSPEVVASLDWSAPSATFPLFSQMLRLPDFTFAVLVGFVVSVGGLTESLILHSGESLTSFLHSVGEDQDEMQRVCRMLLEVLEKHLKNERVSLPYLKMMEQLLSAGCFDPVVDTDFGQEFGQGLVDLVKKEVLQSKNPQKLMAAADVLCGILQFPGEARRRALVQLAIFLCHRYPRVRKTTADKLYEALLTYDDVVEDDPTMITGDTDNEESRLEQVMSILSETEWDAKDLAKDVKPIRNKLCDLLGVPAPIPVPKKPI